MDLSKIIIWNVRGLNKKARRDAVRQTIVSARPDMVCLQETKKASISRFMVMSLLGSEFDHFICLPALGTRGGILVAWKGGTCKVLQTRVDSFSVSVQVDHISGTPWWFTGVYGPQPDDQKLQFLNELRTFRSACFGPWIIGGDVNLIYRAEDKNNSNLDRAMMGRFRRILNELNLSELPLMGRKFTWSNERASPTLVRLDRVFHTSDWGDYFPDCVLQSSATFISDHCPLLLGLHEYSQGRRRFHFESYWPKLEGFMEKVEESWVQPVGSFCPLQRFAVKLKSLSKHLQSWSQRSVGNVKNQLLAAKEIMHQLEIAGDSRALLPLEEWLRRRLKLHSLALSSMERTMARTRGGLRWLKEGEANTSFFHQQARYRKKKNFIATLKVADRILVEQEEKQEVVWDFYNNLLGTAVQRNCSLNLAAFHIPTRNLEQLERDVTEAEVWATINSIPSDKAPGPDGYTGRFYKHAWPIIKGDFMAAMGRILLGDVSNLHLLNSALVTTS
jgi:exonuclease III